MAFPDDYGRRCELRIPASPAALTDWTLVLTEAGLPAEIFSLADDGGGDIRFSADQAGATQLACDVRHFSAAGTADIAVKVLSTSVVAPTSIWVWYNSPGDTQPAPTDTYGQYNAYDADYIFVWSMNEDPGPGGVGDIKDRTSSQIHGTATASFTSGNLVDGQVFKALRTTNVYNEYVSSDSAVPATDLPYTQEVVFKARSVAGSFNNIIHNSVSSILSLQMTGAEFRQLYNWSEATGLTITQDQWAYGYHRLQASTTILGLDKSIYDYGKRERSVGTGTISLGQQTGTAGREFDGDIDEIRFSTTDRGQPWLDYVHDNLMAMATFVTVGIPESPPGSDILTTVTATNPSGTDAEQFTWTEVAPP